MLQCQGEQVGVWPFFPEGPLGAPQSTFQVATLQFSRVPGAPAWRVGCLPLNSWICLLGLESQYS